MEIFYCLVAADVLLAALCRAYSIPEPANSETYMHESDAKDAPNPI
jgi:hypothetical protein